MSLDWLEIRSRGSRSQAQSLPSKTLELQQVNLFIGLSMSTYL